MRFYKITNREELHYGHQYHDGLNVDAIPFNPTGECSAGGLYFFNEVQLLNWFIWIPDQFCAVWIREVTIPQGAQVYHEEGKSKADKIILNPRYAFYDTNIDKYIDFTNPEICIAAVKEHPWALRYVKEQTEQICIEAVSRNKYTIAFVKNVTDNIIKAALF